MPIFQAHEKLFLLGTAGVLCQIVSLGNIQHLDTYLRICVEH